MPASRWHCPDGKDAWLMGVLNCTPDSFSDGGRYTDTVDAVRHGMRMWEKGAAVIDVGGESTRPGAHPVPLAEELRRTIPVVQALSAEGVFVSIDTSKPEVMRQAIAAGARMVNDVSALRNGDASMQVVVDTGVDVCLMHMRGTPSDMQKHPSYTDVVSEVLAFLEHRVEACVKAGIRESAIILDPGIGFGKRLADNLALLVGIPRLKQLGFPVLIGLSRKSFLGAITGAPVGDREVETTVADSIAAFCGADMLRVHDIDTHLRAINVAAALRGVKYSLKESTKHV